MLNDNAIENPIAQELRNRMREAPQGATGLWLPMDEIDAMACVLDRQDETIAGLVAGAGAMNQTNDTLAAVLKLFRFYALSAIRLQDRDKVRSYLISWIDRGEFKDLPWPDLDAPAAFLRNLGFVNVDGFVRRPVAPVEGVVS